MRAALPVDDKLDRLAFDTCDDLFDQRPNDLFLGSGRRARTSPCAFKVSAKAHQLGAIGGSDALHLSQNILCVDLILECRDIPEPGIPTRFQLTSDQAIVRINGIVLPPGPGRFIPRLLQVQLKLTLFLGMGFALGRLCLQSCLNAQWLQLGDDLGADGSIDPHAAEREASGAAMIELATAAVIAPGVSALA